VFGFKSSTVRKRWQSLVLAPALAATMLLLGSPATALDQVEYDDQVPVVAYEAAEIAELEQPEPETPVAPEPEVTAEPEPGDATASSPVTGNPDLSEDESSATEENRSNGEYGSTEPDEFRGRVEITPFVGDTASISWAFSPNPIGPNETTTLTYTITRIGSGGDPVTDQILWSGISDAAGIADTATFNVTSMFGGTCGWAWDPSAPSPTANDFENLDVTLPAGSDTCTLTVTVNGGPETGEFEVGYEGGFERSGGPNLIVSADHTHTVTVSASPAAGGSASANPTSQVPGGSVQLSAAPALGYHFVGWQVLSGNVTLSNPSDPNATFTMPDGNVQLQAVFAPDEPTPPPPPVFQVTAEPSETAGGTATASVTQAPEGAVVNLSATANPGYTFTRWEVIDNATGQVIFTSTNPNASFPMPASNVTAIAIFTPVQPPVPGQYVVTAVASPTEGGTASASVSSAAPGATVTLSAAANPGYTFTRWEVIDNATGAVIYTFTDPDASFAMPNSDVTVVAIFTEDAEPEPEPTPTPTPPQPWPPKRPHHRPPHHWNRPSPIAPAKPGPSAQPGHATAAQHPVTGIWLGLLPLAAATTGAGVALKRKQR